MFPLVSGFFFALLSLFPSANLTSKAPNDASRKRARACHRERASLFPYNFIIGSAQKLIKDDAAVWEESERKIPPDVSI